MSSNVTTLSPEKEKKRPSVSVKCLLNIKSIVTQNISSNRNSRNSLTSTLPPLPLVDPLVSPKQSINHSNSTKEIEEATSKNLQSPSNQTVVIKCLEKSFNEQISPNNEHDQSNIENDNSQSNFDKEQKEIQPIIPIFISKESNSEHIPSQIVSPMTNNGTSMIPPLPLNCSIYPFNSYSSSHHTKPSLSFPAQSSNRINEEYLTKMHQIIESSSSTNSNETEPIELPIHHSQSIPIHRLDCALPAMSRDDSEDNNIDLSSSLVFVNSSLHLQRKSDILPTTRDQNRSIKSHLNEPSKQEYHSNQKLINSHAQNPRFNQRGSTNFTRLPHSLRDKNGSFNSPSSPGTFQPSAANNPFGRRSYPQFESVRTPMQNSSTRKQESQSKIPSEVFNCCQTETVRSSTDISSTQRNVNRRYSTTTENQLNESEMRSNYFRDVTKIRDIMLNASKRLTNENDLPIPIVDTHCHFDLIFDRLRIKHNNLNQYFNDYKEYYPPGLSFELAIQVFWRPKHLTEDNWVKWYSKYLDDERVYGSCGIHPHWSSSWNDTSNDDIERCLQHPKIVAIGEIGLDYGPKNSCLPYQQRQAFEAQLKLAAKWLKPIVIHSRDAYQETFSLMKQYLESDHKIHLHCFVGTMDDVYLFTSYFTEIKFGFTPIITRFNFLHTVIQQLELTQILSETDSPYFIPDELYAVSKCAHPGMVYSVVEMVAKVRQLPISYVATQLRENARHIYGI